jgi:hypothetical protein
VIDFSPNHCHVVRVEFSFFGGYQLVQDAALWFGLSEALMCCGCSVCWLVFGLALYQLPGYFFYEIGTPFHGVYP